MSQRLMCVSMCAVTFLFATNPSHAQTASSLLMRPWAGAYEADFAPGGWSQSTGDADQGGADVRLSGYQASGRWQLDPADPKSPTAAISWHQIDIQTSDAALPERLVDISIAGSMLFDLEDHKSLRVTLGGGYAGDNAFGDGRAYYGLADLVFTQPLDETSGYMILLSYNGNRSFLPDVPLPGFIYYDVLDEQTSYSLGLPASSITHRFDDQTTVRATYVLPFNVNASIEHQLDDELTLFGRFDSQINAYTLDRYPDNRRLMFSQEQIEAGLVWRDSGIELSVAGGYALNQVFTRGFDARDDSTVRDISDEPYVRVGLGLRF